MSVPAWQTLLKFRAVEPGSLLLLLAEEAADLLAKILDILSARRHTMPSLRDAPEGSATPTAGNTDFRSEAGMSAPVSFIATDGVSQKRLSHKSRTDSQLNRYCTNRIAAHEYIGLLRCHANFQLAVLCKCRPRAHCGEDRENGGGNGQSRPYHGISALPRLILRPKQTGAFACCTSCTLKLSASQDSDRAHVPQCSASHVGKLGLYESSFRSVRQSSEGRPLV